jgi:hypothetical protein
MTPVPAVACARATIAKRRRLCCPPKTLPYRLIARPLETPIIRVYMPRNTGGGRTLERVAWHDHGTTLNPPQGFHVEGGRQRVALSATQAARTWLDGVDTMDRRDQVKGAWAWPRVFMEWRWAHTFMPWGLPHNLHRRSLHSCADDCCIDDRCTDDCCTDDPRGSGGRQRFAAPHRQHERGWTASTMDRLISEEHFLSVEV